MGTIIFDYGNGTQTKIDHCRGHSVGPSTFPGLSRDSVGGQILCRVWARATRTVVQGELFLGAIHFRRFFVEQRLGIRVGEIRPVIAVHLPVSWNRVQCIGFIRM
jgi:hypothetical protein